MLWAQRYAYESRARMNRELLRSLAQVVSPKPKVKVKVKSITVAVVNCHHNYTERETHGGQDLWITRKGAIKAGPGDLGVIPGSIGEILGDNDVMGHDELAATRRSLHGVAELVLAGPQYRATGRLRLGVVAGGFATTALSPRLLVDGSRVAAAEGVTAVVIGGRTPRALGTELGVAVGRPDGLYQDGSGVDPDETLALDPDQAGVIMGALALGHDALTAFAAGESPVLWPEHFDVAIRVHDMNFGVSPGDGFIEEPYAYVGVSSPPAGDAFWNAPFGAAVPLRRLPDASAVSGFFADGRARARLAKAPPLLLTPWTNCPVLLQDVPYLLHA
jgi:hypothetical protein